MHNSSLIPLQELERIMSMPTRCHKITNDLPTLKNIIQESINKNTDSSTLFIGKRIRVSVPGSCANLGSGFDVFGIAVGLYLIAEVEVSQRKVFVCCQYRVIISFN